MLECAIALLLLVARVLAGVEILALEPAVIACSECLVVSLRVLVLPVALAVRVDALLFRNRVDLV
jgi:hypothetical protein